MEIKSGLDQVDAGNYLSIFMGARVGLLTGPSGISASLVSSIDILKKRCNLTALFGAEHGIRGDVAAGGTVETYSDPRTGLQVYSLYDKTRIPKPEMLRDIDIMAIDIQDIGCRYFTYISCMKGVMEACAKAGKKVVVLDRSNPINGLSVEGNIPEQNLLSYVGAMAIPNRHGMTIGELALFLNGEQGINCELDVIPAAGWNREKYADETGFLWVSPSPNITCLATAIVYPGTCLFEGTTISEGRGTTKPFEYIGAPWLDAEDLAEELNRLKMPGVLFRPVYFKPYTSKHAGLLCKGVQLHITDKLALHPVCVGVEMLKVIAARSGDKFEWIKSEEEKGSFFIDLLAGTEILRKYEWDKYIEDCKRGAESFKHLRTKYLIYQQD